VLAESTGNGYAREHVHTAEAQPADRESEGHELEIETTDHSGEARRIAVTLSGPSRSPSRSHAYCPLCGRARRQTFLSDVRGAEDAVCPGRCADAWRVLAMLKQRESESERIQMRFRSEYAGQKPHLPTLSALLLRRWRAGDWTTTPADVVQLIEG
jgi:hypothetical protein